MIPEKNQYLASRELRRKNLTLMSSKFELKIWSCDAGQWIPCFDRCHLIITWISNTKEVHSKPRLHVSPSTCYLEYGRHVARLRRRRAYAPTSNTASHDNHEKINSWVSFCFSYMGCLWGSAWRPFGPPELRYEATHWERGQFIEFISPVRSEMMWSIHEIIHIFELRL